VDGALGDVYLCKAREAGDFLFGSKSERDMIEGKTQWSWYFDPKMTGGGCLISMGCHPIQYVRHVFDKAPVKRVYAEIMEKVGSSKPKGIEDAVLLTMKFADGRVGAIEASFYADGGQADKTEIYGNKGTILVDLYNRNPVTVHSHVGYSFGQSVFVPQGETRGWTFPIPDEIYSLGYYHEQRHFLRCILRDERPSVNFDDGRATLEIIEAGYESHRRETAITLPLS